MPITTKCLQYRGNSRVVGKQEPGIRPDNFSIARHPATNPADGLTGICAQGLSIALQGALRLQVVHFRPSAVYNVPTLVS